MHKRMGCKADGEFLNNYSNQRAPVAVKKAERKGMHKRMGCKADGEDEHRSNLMVVRISSNRPTQQTAF